MQGQHITQTQTKSRFRRCAFICITNKQLSVLMMSKIGEFCSSHKYLCLHHIDFVSIITVFFISKGLTKPKANMHKKHLSDKNELNKRIICPRHTTYVIRWATFRCPGTQSLDSRQCVNDVVISVYGCSSFNCLIFAIAQCFYMTITALVSELTCTDRLVAVTLRRTGVRIR